MANMAIDGKKFFCVALFSLALAFPTVADNTWSVSLFKTMQAESAKEVKANPWMDSHGATWGFYYNGTASSAGTPAAEWNKASPMVGFTSPIQYATLQANVETYASGGAQGGDKVNPGECYIHPYGSSSYERIRYVAGEAGVYSMTGVVRCLNGSSNGVKVDIIAGGVVVATATTTSDKAAVAFAAEGIRLWKGEVLDFRFDCNGQITYDATGLRLVVSRTGDMIPPITVSAYDAIVSATGGETMANPWTDSNGRPGSWTFLRRSGSTDTILGVDWQYSKTSTFFGFKGSSDYPKLLVNTGTSSVTEDNTSVPAKSVYYHPEYDGTSKLILRYTVAKDGFYSYEAFCRSLNSSTGGNGVNIAAYMRAGFAEVSLASGLALQGGTANLSDSRIAMLAGDSLEIQVDSNGAHSFDASQLGFTVTFNEACEGLARSQVSDALFANLQSGSPTAGGYVDENGGVWSYGRYTAMNSPGSFAAYSNYGGSGDFQGFNGGYDVNGLKYGYLLMNLQNATASFNGGTVTAGNVAVHPLNDQVPVVRYAASEDGLYSCFGYCRHLNSSSGGDGVNAAIVVGGFGYAAYSRCSAVSSQGLPNRAHAMANGLWLSAGETIDFAVGNGGSGSYTCDASEMNGMISRVGPLPGLLRANFDICGTSRQPYSGAGRVGLPADGVWTAVLPGSTRSVFGYVAGERREAKLILSRVAGSSTLSGVATVLSDGVESAGAADPVSFSVTGLVPGAEYVFYAYSRNASGENGVFTVGGSQYVADQAWFHPTGGDYCSFTAVADSEGTVSGTFSGTSNGAATFCALQILGEAFPVRSSRGIAVSFR